MTARRRLADDGALRFAMRARAMWGHRAMARRRPREAWRHLLHSREIANFTYELANEDAIPAFLAGVLGTDEAEHRRHLGELRADEELMGELRSRLAGVARRDPEPRLGKRRLQYCIARSERPALAVESGVHDGMGTAVLLRALERNEAEGRPGRLIALDVNPEAGWLVDAERHAARFTFVAGDVRETLPAALEGQGPVGFFVHDSLKTREHEAFELETALAHRGGRQVLYTDDAGVTGAMAEVSAATGGTWAGFAEDPLRHYWRGNLLGVCAVG